MPMSIVCEWNHSAGAGLRQFCSPSACAAWKLVGMPTVNIITIWGQRPARALDPVRCQTKRRLVALLRETFSLVASRLDRQTRGDGADMVKLIDATPIPLGKRAIGPNRTGDPRLKMHVVFDRMATSEHLDITMPTSTTPGSLGRTITIEPGASYVL